MKLNLGCGENPIPGYDNLDRKRGHEVFPLAYPDNSADEIRASHILEHFSFSEARAALADWFRVLKPGGGILLAVPNAVLCLQARNDGDQLWSRYLMGGQTDANDFHRSCWSCADLKAELAAAGFANISGWETDGLDTSAHKVSLNLRATKPAAAAPRVAEIKMVAVMSIPRLGFNDTWGCIVDALRPFQIPVRRYTGAFWGQCLQTVLEGCVADGIDWALCLDYDSVFTARQLDRLIGTFGQHPEIDALAALQPKRSEGTPLMTIKGRKGITVDGRPIRVDTAHFGLTLIRLDALAQMPKPWFWSRPGPDGTWDHAEKLDDDIWFWHQWRNHGKTVYVDPEVRLGHLELMVSQFTPDMELERITVKEWRERTKHEG